MSTVNPIQFNTYTLSINNGTISFGDQTDIEAGSGIGVYGGNKAYSWVVTNHGDITGASGVMLDFISMFNNAGTVHGTANAGVAMNGGGLFTNREGAAIYGGSGSTGWGVTTGTGAGYGSVDNNFSNFGLIHGAGGGAKLVGWTRATNTGTLEGGATGMEMDGGGVLKNTGTITGASDTGAYLGGTAIVNDFGTITGGVNAVKFAGAGDNSLILQSGATIHGNVVGSTAVGATNTLTLKGSGVLDGSVQHFDRLVATDTGTWVLHGVSDVGSASVKLGSTLQVGDVLHPTTSLTVDGGLANQGVIDVTGALNLPGQVTGTGSMFILGGTLEVGGALKQTIGFGAAGGLLQLDQSQTFKGNVLGWGPTGTALDLRDIGFTRPGEATFSGDATGGKLSVSDGVHTASINLTGNYLASTFTVQSDGHGGVLVYDPASATNAHLADLIHQTLGVSLLG